MKKQQNKKGLKVAFEHDKLPKPEQTTAILFFDGVEIARATVKRWHDDKSNKKVAETFALCKIFEDPNTSNIEVSYKDFAALFLTIK